MHISNFSHLLAVKYIFSDCKGKIQAEGEATSSVSVCPFFRFSATLSEPGFRKTSQYADLLNLTDFKMLSKLRRQYSKLNMKTILF
jgi:hypothetical protein